jgi:uncharacterized membrane protein
VKRLLILALGAVSSQASVLGCAACFGKSDSAMAYGMNAGIMTLLVVILSMLSLIASFFVFIIRRATRLETASDLTPPSASP